MDERQAKQLVAHWIAAWNNHDLDSIMEHYEDEVVLISPVAARILSDPAGTVRGKPALRAYFARGLEFYPDLKFELLDTLSGLSSLVLCYKNQNGARTAEFMEIAENGKVTRVIANYAGLSTPDTPVSCAHAIGYHEADVDVALTRAPRTDCRPQFLPLPADPWRCPQ